MSFFRKVFSFSFFTAISRLFGLVRDTIIAYKVGAGSSSDIFFVAIKVPNFLRAIFAEGAFTQAFIPIYNKILKTDDDNAKKFANNIYFILLVILIFVVIVAEIFMDKLMILFAPGFISDSAKFAHLVLISRITFPYLIFISICCIYSAILNSHHKYAPTAIVPIITNIFLISGIFLLFDYTQDNILSLAIAFVIAGLFQVFYLIYHLAKLGQKIRPQYSGILANEKSFFRKILPAIIGASVLQLNAWIDVIFASTMPNVVSYYNYSERILNLPVALIITSITIVLLPSLTQAIQNNNREESRIYNYKSMHLSLLLVLPAAIGLFCLSDQIIYSLFARGKFALEATYASGAVLKALAFSLPPFCIMRIINTNFFARSNTRVPMQIALALMILNIIFNFIFIHYFDFVGIAISTTVISWIGIAISLYILNQRYGNLFDFRNNARFYLNIIIASMIMAIITLYLRNKIFIELNLSEIERFLKLFLIILAAITSYLVSVIALFGSFKKFRQYF